MSQPLTRRAQEWLADRAASVQYPKPLHSSVRSEKLSQRINFGQMIGIFSIGLAALAVGSVLLMFGALMIASLLGF